MYDLHIVGGGPAGCFAGIAACLQGKKVLLSEEHREIGRPEACSGLVSKSGLDSLLPHVNWREAALNTITSARINCEWAGAASQEFVITPKEEAAVLVSRSGLDTLAAESFVSQGGYLRLGNKVTRNFESKCIIGADGPASSVADHFGFPKIPSFVACMQGEFAYSCAEPHQAEIYLSAQDFPGFFGWVIPLDEHTAKIGLGVSLPNHPLAYYRSFVRKLGIEAKPQHEFSAVIPVFVRQRTAMQKSGYNILLAGDAAGQVKATTGGGIFFGAQCGFLAGRNSESPDNYERQWRNRFGLDLKMDHLFRSALNMGGGSPHPLVFSAAKALFFEDLVSEKGKMDRWGKMLEPSLLSSYAGIVARRMAGAIA